MTNAPGARRIEAVRRFTRFYTRHLGVLQEGLLDSPYSLAEARVIYELAHRKQATATELAQELGLDAGYLSRILRGFDRHGLVRRVPSRTDARQSVITLTPAGTEAFAGLNAASKHQVAALLKPLLPSEQDRLIDAMAVVERLMGARTEPQVPYVLRPHQSGDMGWVVQRHGVLYMQEYGWNTAFEALVAEIVAGFIQHFDAERERCWIAERDGENVGSVFLVRDPKRKHVAKLRLLLVEPSARGLGIGRRLVQECARFARQAGYKRITLWTNSVLVSARAIYEREGYQLVAEEQHHSFGHDLVGETWELEL